MTREVRKPAHRETTWRRNLSHGEANLRLFVRRSPKLTLENKGATFEKSTFQPEFLGLSGYEPRFYSVSLNENG